MSLEKYENMFRREQAQQAGDALVDQMLQKVIDLMSEWDEFDELDKLGELDKLDKVVKLDEFGWIR